MKTEYVVRINIVDQADPDYQTVYDSGFLVCGAKPHNDDHPRWWLFAVIHVEFRSKADSGRLYWINHFTKQCSPYFDEDGNPTDPPAEVERI